MSQTQPDIMLAPTAAEASVVERAKFLQKTYTWVFIGILGFCATLWAFDHVQPVRDLGLMLFRSPIVYLVVILGGAWLVHKVAETSPINVIAYFSWIFLLGLSAGPLVSLANATAPELVSQASLITAITFLGLTAYVFISGKDFSFMRGFLMVGLFGLIGVGLAGWLFGFDVGIWFSVAGALLMAGYILYDTSMVLHHYPTTAHVSAAIVLVTDVILLFQYILSILMRSRD